MSYTEGDNVIFRIREAIRAAYDDGSEALAVAREVAAAFGISYVQAFAGTARPLTDEEETRLSLMVARLREGWPVQYVTGRAWFMDHEYSVCPGVLIPRPETEDVACAAAEALKGTVAPRVVDVGTGSGCIAISLKLALDDAQVTGVDISPEALAVARHNAKRLGADVPVVWGDVTKPETMPAGPFDLVVSNPPYVRRSERGAMAVRVKDHEPEVALFVPDGDALVFYRALAAYGQRVLPPGGRLVVEINSVLGRETAAVFKASGYREVTVLKDRYDKDRVIRCLKV